MKRLLIALSLLPAPAFAGTLPAPSQASLDALLAKADKVRVLAGGETYGKALEDKVLLTADKPADLAELRAALVLGEGKPQANDHCLGDPSFEFSRGGEILAVIGQHHGAAIRWDTAWSADGVLEDGRKLTRWLADRGAPGAEAERAEEERRRKDGDAAIAAWEKAMPEALRPGWRTLLTERLDEPKLADMRARLAKAVPAEKERIAALLSWFGSGAGPWSGFPSYEEAPLRLLLEYPTSAILAVVERKDAPEARKEGAARYFADWHFVREKPADLKSLPRSVRKDLLEQAMKSTDMDRRERAKQAFKPADRP